MNILFLDDEMARFAIFKRRFPNDTVVFAQTLPVGQSFLKLHMEGHTYFDIVTFDHDMYDPNAKVWYNSQGLADWFVTNCPKDKLPKIAVVHSVNEQGAWALYHIFMKVMKTWRSPFRLESRDEYLHAAEMGKSLELEGS